MASREVQEELNVEEQDENDTLGSQIQTPPLGVGARRRATKRTRGRSGCLNCRRRRKKCDEKKPICSKCSSRGESCEWDTQVTFRNKGIDASLLPAKQNGRSGRQPNEFPIANIEESRIKNTSIPVKNKDYAISEDSYRQLASTPQQQQRWIWQEPLSSVNLETPQNNKGIQSPPMESVNFGNPNEVNIERMTSSSNEVGRLSLPSISMLNYSRPIDATGRSPPDFSRTGVSNQHASPANATAPTFLDQGSAITSPLNAAASTAQELESPVIFNAMDSYLSGIDAADLEALDYLIANPTNATLMSPTVARMNGFPWSSDQNHEVLPEDPIIGGSPDLYNTYYPNTAYRELHTVLHNYMVQTARATGLTRQGTPTTTSDTISSVSKDTVTSQQLDQASIPGTLSPTGPPEGAKLTNRRELELWQNYLDEIAVWLDMFDVDRHFQLTIPLMARSAEHLRYSILALSARQKERKDPENPYIESLTLYQKAIELIVQELHSLDTAVIASCVLLCVLEMMSSSPRAWGRHLDGCSMLLQAAGSNGTIGGIRQALFWCFARMDVWGGFLSDTRTKIPTSQWITPGQSMSMAVAQFKTSSGGSGNYANYAVFLCASVVNLLSNSSPSAGGQSKSSPEAKASSSAPWKLLFDLLEDWYNSRPEEMLPLMSCPAISEEYHHPFPILLYGTSPAVNGNQLYHASSLLMLQEKPKDIRLARSHKSIQWHARQICGIATSNHNHGPWINALQPLWIAGRVMSHPIEHRVILDLLAHIEKETGWATSWRAEDLKEYWGDMEE